MIKMLGLTTNIQNEPDYFRKLNSTRNKNSSCKSIKSNIPLSPKKNLSKAANENTAKKKSRRKSIKKGSEEKKKSKGYKYIQQKAINYINANNKTNNKKNYDISNIINITNNNSNKKNKNKNKKNSKIRKSIDEQNTTQIKNLTCDKKIKEIKIKTKFNMSYINLFVNKNSPKQNQITCSKEEHLNTVNNMNISAEKNNTMIRPNPICDGIYKKKLKIFNSLSMEKISPRTRNTIESIEISFRRPKLFINKFQAFNIYEKEKDKIIFIQKKFRQFLVRKFRRIFYEKITKGILCLNRLMKKKIFFWYKNIFSCEINNNVYYVDESQIELLNALKEKNIYSMIDLKKYIVSLIKNNKLEMF